MAHLKVTVFFTSMLFALGLLAQPEVKDPDPPAGGNGLPARATGGPDAFGYTWDDSVPFVFADISGTGTPVFSGDDVSGVVTLAVPFNFYGAVYSSLTMASNGYISTDPTDTGPDLSNDCPLPAQPSTGGGARIYPLHDDLISDGFYQYFEPCPRASDLGGNLGCHVFQWANTNHFGGADSFNIWAILYDKSWEIVSQVGTGNSENGSGSTTGLQNDGATIGLTYACVTAGSVPDNAAVAFFHPFPELCDILSLTLTGLLLTITGDCAEFDLWARRKNQPPELVAAGLSVSGSITIDVSDFPGRMFFVMLPGGDPNVDPPVGGLISACSIPTLGEWGMMALLSLLGIAGLYFMRRQSSAI